MGDTVVALPCFHAIARRYPDHRRLVLTNDPVTAGAPGLLEVLGTQGLVHGALTYPVGLRHPLKLLRLAQRLRALHANELIYLSPARGPGSIERDALFFKACGFSDIIGLPRQADLSRCRVSDTGQVEREAHRLARTLEPALGPVGVADPANWDLVLSDAERNAAAQALASLKGVPFIAINTGGKDAAKDWGDANWTALLGFLSGRRPGLGLAILGAASDAERADRLTNAWTGPTLDLCGRLGPRQSAAVLERASLFVGHDSGALHLAAIGGAPTLGLFGALNRPVQWHPVGDRVRILHKLDGLDKITVAEVAAAAEDMLSR